jgi:hypothetical protein
MFSIEIADQVRTFSVICMLMGGVPMLLGCKGLYMSFVHGFTSPEGPAYFRTVNAVMVFGGAVFFFGPLVYMVLHYLSIINSI